ncbi:hypothetical protein HDU78_009327 [Chytriomyces hyalinus]|nr:hypothetical protein HDU78_009327 [Chytriomyces hyalinus]KAJ3246000.1 hypothetical protein HDU77_009136 [Chytriomyces hyalinus]
MHLSSYTTAALLFSFFSHAHGAGAQSSTSELLAALNSQSCLVKCVNGPVPVTDSNVSDVCSKVSNGTANMEAVDCIGKCPYPTDEKSAAAVGKVIMEGCMIVLGPQMLTQIVQQSPPCFLSCINDGSDKVTEATLAKFCAFSADPKKELSSIDPCIKKSCNATVQAQIATTLQDVPAMNDTSNPFITLCGPYLANPTHSQQSGATPTNTGAGAAAAASGTSSQVLTPTPKSHAIEAMVLSLGFAGAAVAFLL